MALTNPHDIERHREFKKDVDDLSKRGHLRHYTAEIKRKTGERTGNITNFYKGKKAIDDDFLKKFQKAYGRILKEIRQPVKDSDLPLASNVEIQPLQEQQHLTYFHETIAEMLIDIQESIAILEKKLNYQQQILDTPQTLPAKRNNSVQSMYHKRTSPAPINPSST